MIKVKNDFLIFSKILIILTFVSILIAIGIPSRINNSEQGQNDQALELPSINSWNGFNSHQVVTECVNLSSIPTNYILEVFDRSNTLLARIIHDPPTASGDCPILPALCAIFRPQCASAHCRPKKVTKHL